MLRRRQCQERRMARSSGQRMLERRMRPGMRSRIRQMAVVIFTTRFLVDRANQRRMRRLLRMRPVKAVRRLRLMRLLLRMRPVKAVRRLRLMWLLLRMRLGKAVRRQRLMRHLLRMRPGKAVRRQRLMRHLLRMRPVKAVRRLLRKAAIQRMLARLRRQAKAARAVSLQRARL